MVPPGTMFGHECIVLGRPWNVVAKAVTRVHAFVHDAASFRAMLSGSPKLHGILSAYTRAQLGEPTYASSKL